MNSNKLKVDQKISGWAWLEIGVTSQITALKLTLSQEWIDGVNWFFAWWCKFRKAKSYFNTFSVGMVKNGHVRVIHETLRSAEWVYELSRFFASWLWCSHFWLDQHRTLHLWLSNASQLQLYLVDPWW